MERGTQVHMGDLLHVIIDWLFVCLFPAKKKASMKSDVAES